jgi:hypothetical protein
VQLLERLAPLYLGPDADFPPAAMRDIPGYITRITPARFTGIGAVGRTSSRLKESTIVR